MEKLNDLREDTWNYVHTCMLVTAENIPCKLERPFPQQTVNLLGLTGVSQITHTAVCQSPWV